MRRVRFYVGTNVDGTKKHTIEDVARYCAANVKGVTVYPARGVWNGTQEDTAIVEVLGGIIDRHDAFVIEPETFARRLKKYFSQEAVLMTIDEVDSEVI